MHGYYYDHGQSRTHPLVFNKKKISFDLKKKWNILNYVTAIQSIRFNERINKQSFSFIFKSYAVS